MGEIIVEDTKPLSANPRAHSQIKRYVFIKRIGCLRIVAKCVGGAHPQAASRLVCVTALLAKAVIMLLRIPRQIMGKAWRIAPINVSLGLPVLEDRHKIGLWVCPERPSQG